MNDLVQSPVTLSVTPTVLHGGRYPGGYRIINTSLKATVWVSQNPGMSAGQGTSIQPGTSVAWIRDGDLFLILGTDTPSTDAGKATVILSYDVGDWQPNPVAVASAAINRQSNLGRFSGAAASTLLLNSINGPIGVIDGSLFGSLLLSVIPPGPAVNIVQIIVYQYFTLADAINGTVTNARWQNVFQWQVGATAVLMNVQIPLRSPYVRLAFNSNDFVADQWQIGLALSTMQIPEVIWDRFNDPAPLAQASFTPGAGTTTAITYLSYPYVGDVDVYARLQAGAAISGYIRLIELGVANRLFPMSSPAGFIANSCYGYQRISLVGETTGFAVTNTGAAAATSGLLIVTKATSSGS